MLLIQQGPVDTSGYMIAGYAVIFGVMLIYWISLVVRRRNLQGEIDRLQKLNKKKS
jgi:hypothetical protein